MYVENAAFTTMVLNKMSVLAIDEKIHPILKTYQRLSTTSYKLYFCALCPDNLYVSRK